MKPIAIATLILALLGGSTQAFAGGGGYDGGYHGGYNGYHGGYNGYHGGGYWHGGGYYRPAYYPYYGYHNNNNNYNNGIYYALGGLVLGGILANTYYQNRVAQPVYVQQTYQPPPVVVVPQGRHLVRDLNGNCYERTTDAAGNELRTELPPANCNW